MRKIYAILPLACALTFTACDDYDDTALWEAVNGLEERIAALEQWQDETNNNIAALQKLLTTNDMITSVTPVMMGEETIGYTISFLHSDPITIYHGEKGDKGEDGADGSTPQIGLTQQEDGNWYWTLNGSLMKDSEGNPIRANGEDGQDGQDGEDGADGEDGQDGRPGSTGPQGKPGADGEDGENAPAPQIMLGNSLADDDKIMPEGSTKDPNAWYLSVDNGTTWYRVSGKDGSAGDDGESFFTQKPDVDYDKGTVTFYIDGGSFEVPLHIDYIVEDDGSYSVYSEDGLKAVADIANNGNRSINITLDKDIDLTGTTWTPIGTSSNSYTGTFDGGNHTITGLTVTGSNEYAGLFGYIGSGGKVKNVVLEGVQITSDNSLGYTGGVVGNSWGTIENCSVSGSVSGTTFAGGVVGSQWGGSITGCNSSATVKGEAYVGGIAGETNSGASLTGCYATGDVTVENNGTNNSHAGGVVGYNGGGTLTACYATGSVTGTGDGTGSCYVGGVTGDNSSGTLTACYHAKGTVNGPDEYTGGVAGRNFKDSMFGGGIITACYWGSNPNTGIGENQAGTGDTEKVDGDWTDAVTQMNKALSGTSWQYEASSDDDFPLVIKATN